MSFNYLMSQYSTMTKKMFEAAEMNIENEWIEGYYSLYDMKINQNFGELKILETHKELIEELDNNMLWTSKSLNAMEYNSMEIITESLETLGENQDLIQTNNTEITRQLNNDLEIVTESVNYQENRVVSNVTVNNNIQNKTYYDGLTAEEINLLEVVVQHEVGNLSKTYKTLIAELLYNRLKSGIYPSNVKEMLYQEGQFQGIEEWYSPNFEVDAETRQVIKEVFSKGNTTHKATAYYNPDLSSKEGIEWFENSGDVEFLFEYEEESWGVIYRTRFFN